jgi:hypothetical protein
MTRGARLVVALLLIGGAASCSDESPAPVTLVPTTRATELTADPPDTAADADSGATTADELVDACSALGRAFATAIGASGPANVVQPLYDAVTPLLPEESRADWSIATAAFVAYEDAAFAVEPGDDQLSDPDVAEAYEEATSADVQDALERVRADIEAACPDALS